MGTLLPSAGAPPPPPNPIASPGRVATVGSSDVMTGGTTNGDATAAADGTAAAVAVVRAAGWVRVTAPPATGGALCGTPGGDGAAAAAAAAACAMAVAVIPRGGPRTDGAMGVNTSSPGNNAGATFSRCCAQGEWTHNDGADVAPVAVAAIVARLLGAAGSIGVMPRSVTNRRHSAGVTAMGSMPGCDGVNSVDIGAVAARGSMVRPATAGRRRAVDGSPAVGLLLSLPSPPTGKGAANGDTAWANPTSRLVTSLPAVA